MKHLKDPGSAITHFIGMMMALFAALPLMLRAVHNPDRIHILSLLVFIVSMVLLYAASTLYHSLNLSEKMNRILKKTDHMMIFVLIAGTYTPICLVSLHGTWGWTLLVAIWAFALFGLLLKIFWMGAPRWLSTLIYVVMGWLAVFAFVPLEKAVSWKGIGMLLAGGIAYTVGAIIYGLKKPNIAMLKNFGFHEIFHVFVLAGSGIHIAFMFQYVL